jgi:hypothetical protein
MRKYYAKNKDKMLEYFKTYYKDNCDEIIEKYEVLLGT